MIHMSTKARQAARFLALRWHEFYLARTEFNVKKSEAAAKEVVKWGPLLRTAQEETGIELMRDVVIGQYIDAAQMVIDARAKEEQ